MRNLYPLPGRLGLLCLLLFGGLPLLAQDTTPPVLVCETDVTIYVDDNGDASADIDDVVISETDDTDADPLGPFFVPNMGANVFDCDSVGGTYVRQLEIGDVAGNRDTCTFNVMVLDTTPPVLTCVASIEAYLDENGEASIDPEDVVVSESDNCEMDPIGPFFVPNMGANMFTCDDVGTPLERMVEVGDMSGNRDSCTFEVIVLDTIAPNVDGMDATIDLDANGQAFLFIADVVDLATLGD
ncbi:MAG: hypothetical protein AAFZ52_05070, partial [Bacteroidota bacterium]